MRATCRSDRSRRKTGCVNRMSMRQGKTPVIATEGKIVTSEET